MIPLLYKDRRREGETVLRQCQLVQLHLLHVFDRVCKENGLRYVLEGGTLLGAMRHNGFIPWDDDLDVGMPRRDYEKFLKIAPSVLPKDVYVQTPSETPRTAIPFAKIRDAYSFYCESRPDISTSAPSGIYVDIFPYDDMPDVGFPFQRFLSLACGSSWARTRFFLNKVGMNPLANVLYLTIAALCQLIHSLVRLFVWFLNLVLPSHYYFLVLENGDTFRYKKSFMFPSSEHVFEDAQFPVPCDADAILTAQYGDWRQVPPIDQRPRHARIIEPCQAAMISKAMEFPADAR